MTIAVVYRQRDNVITTELSTCISSQFKTMLHVTARAGPMRLMNSKFGKDVCTHSIAS